MFTVSVSEAVRYSCGGDEQSVRECTGLLYLVAAPMTVWRAFSRQDITHLLVGNDIMRHLDGCERIVMIAATLGHEVDRRISAMQLTQPDMALVLHGCAVAAVESLCDELEAQLRQKFSDKYLTDRFSPGYGDLPLEIQPLFCNMLDAQRRIGITVDENGWMHPSKSVTAFIGISDTLVTFREYGCARCDRFNTCHGKYKGACRMGGQ